MWYLSNMCVSSLEFRLIRTKICTHKHTQSQNFKQITPHSEIPVFPTTVTSHLYHLYKNNAQARLLFKYRNISVFSKPHVRPEHIKESAYTTKCLSKTGTTERLFHSEISKTAWMPWIRSTFMRAWRRKCHLWRSIRSTSLGNISHLHYSKIEAPQNVSNIRKSRLTKAHIPI